MASSFTLTSDSYSGRYLQLYCTQTTNIATNTSTIKWTLSSIGGSYSQYSTGPTTVIINGVTVYEEQRNNVDFPASTGSVSGTTTVTHNNLGDKSIAVSLSTAIYWYAINTKSGTWTLDSIPRKATITGAADFTDLQNPVFEYSNPAGNSVDALEACISLTTEYSEINYRAISKTGNKYTFPLTDEEKETLYKATLSGSTSRTVYYYLRTKIGDTTFWDSKAKTFTVTNATPTINPTVIDNNPTTTAITGDNSVFISGYSNLQYTFNASAKKHASITSYSAVCGSAKGTSATGTLNGITSNSIAFSVNDNRGLSASKTLAINLINYVPVSCRQDTEIELVGETGAKISVTLSGNYFIGNLGQTANTLTLQYRYKEDNGEYGNWITLTGAPTLKDNTYTLTFPIENLAYDKAYTIQAKASDKLTNANAQDYTAKLIPVFDWSAADFNFNVPIQLNGETVLRHSDTTSNIILSAENGFIYFRTGGTTNQSGEIKFTPQGNIELAGDIIINGKSIKSLLGI